MEFLCPHMLVLLLLYLSAKSIYSQKRSRSFPLRDSLRNEEPIKKKNNREREQLECSKCDHMFRLSENEYENLKDEKRFCVRLMQVSRCVSKLKKLNCHIISLLVLQTGVNLKRKRYECSKKKVSPTDMINILKERRKTKATMADRCKTKVIKSNKTELLHCGIFGDPHIKTFYDKRQTCVVEGLWTLLDNDHMKVQVTNEILQTTQSTSATATTKITVSFKQVHAECVSHKVYEATSEYLPNVFKDGTYFTGPKVCRTEVLKETSNQIIIQSCSLSTTIIIRRVGEYLIFNIQSPFVLVNQTTGLCTNGCPADELVDYETYFENEVNSVESVYDKDLTSISKRMAMEICENANLTDFFFDSCVFDLMTTGNKEFSEAAILAMMDAKTYDPKIRLRRENSIILRSALVDNNVEKESLSSGRTLRPVHHLFHVIIMTLFVSIASSR